MPAYDERKVVQRPPRQFGEIGYNHQERQQIIPRRGQYSNSSYGDWKSGGGGKIAVEPGPFVWWGLDTKVFRERIPAQFVNDRCATKLRWLDNNIRFSDSTSLTNGYWNWDPIGSTSSANTGPTGSNTYPFIYFETSSRQHLVADINSHIRIGRNQPSNSPALKWLNSATNRSIRLVYVITGSTFTGDRRNGLSIFYWTIPDASYSPRTQVADHHIPGWTWGRLVSKGDVGQDVTGDTITCVLDGGWVEKTIFIPDDVRTVDMALIARYGFANFQSDLCIKELDLIGEE